MIFEEKFAHIFQVSEDGVHTYKAASLDLGYGRLFGGQILSQAFLSAAKTVDDTRVCHSLHSYFLRMGHAHLPVRYVVEYVRDGKSFSNRRVKAWQEDVCLFVMSASFQVVEGDAVRSESWKREPKKPEDLISDQVWIEKNKNYLSDRVLKFWTQPSVFEQRSEERLSFCDAIVSESEWATWFRLKGGTQLSGLSTQVMQQALFLWYSDMMILIPALKPHGVTYGNAPFRMASLDHSVWFHQPLCLEEWQLYELSSSFQGGGRTLCHGKVFSRSSCLLATVSQEAFMRDSL
ncbi:MAG: acyl-CoA thioesterase [Oligoflexales bacterium]